MNTIKSSHLNQSAQTHIEKLCESDRQWLEMSASAETKKDVLSAFAISDFIANACSSHTNLLRDFVEEKPLARIQEHQKNLNECLANCANEKDLMRILRQYHQTHMAKIAWYDVLNKQGIEASLSQVSNLADALILAAYHWLYALLIEKYGAPQQNQPLCMIAMGKLGGKELNFSSDIDLIFCYPRKGETAGARKTLEHQVFFTRLAQRLIACLDTITSDGQVYRVDMRLRPFGESGPLVMHFDAVQDYYLEQAREWERYAFVKARILNAECVHTKKLEALIHPFIYKRYLDFTTLDALRDMKQRINADTRRRRLNDNIKLGKGGIREAEFYVQSFQMIHGGREPALQQGNWLKTCDSLVANDHITSEQSLALKSAYLVLRKAEHGLQQIRNEQTQTLPDNEDEDDWERLFLSMGLTSKDALVTKVNAAREIISTLFNQIFDHPEDDAPHESELFQFSDDVWRGKLSEKDIIDASDGLVEPALRAKLASALISFKILCKRNRLSDRSTKRLEQLIPLILHQMLDDKVNNAEQFERVFSLLGAVLGRSTYLDLLLENPEVRGQLIKLCRQSPWVATQLEQFPLLLDELLAPVYLHDQETDVVESKALYESELRQALLRIEIDDTEQLMDALRQFKHCQQLRIAAADINNTLPVEKVSDKLTVLAEVILTHAINMAFQQMVSKYGSPQHLNDQDKGFAAIAYGKMGGWELGYGSDLDLVFIHNAPSDSTTSGTKSVSAQQFYIKVAQRIMHFLNTKTRVGDLYETDLRLRPSGNSGLLCCHISGFEHYQQNDAWTWEHQALVRARAVFGDINLVNEFKRVRSQTLTQVRNLQSLQKEVCGMRKKLFQHWIKDNGKNKLKHGEGGITDIEFLTQYWVLAYSGQHTSLLEWQDNLRIIDSVVSAKRLSEAHGELLKSAYLIQRNTIHHNVLNEDEGNFDTSELAALRQQVKNIWQTILPPYTRSE